MSRTGEAVEPRNRNELGVSGILLQAGDLLDALLGETRCFATRRRGRFDLSSSVRYHLEGSHGDANDTNRKQTFALGAVGQTRCGISE